MKITNTEVWGFKHALRGMRNPLNSWSKVDSGICKGGDGGVGCAKCANKYTCNHEYDGSFQIGVNDMKLAQSLIKAGSEHCKFMRMIHVTADVDMPRYFWSEFDTYSFNTKNSCSTIHKLLNNNNRIELNQFAYCEEDMELLIGVIDALENLRSRYKTIQRTTKDAEEMNRLLVRAKRMLPEGFLQMRTIDTNYAELRNIYFQRRNHKLKEEWQDVFCGWVASLPYAKELIMYEERLG